MSIIRVVAKFGGADDRQPGLRYLGVRLQDAPRINLLLKRAPDFRGDHYDVLADDRVVGQIMLSDAAPLVTPWVWSLAYGQHEDRMPTHGQEATREAARPRRKSWGRT